MTPTQEPQPATKADAQWAAAEAEDALRALTANLARDQVELAMDDVKAVHEALGRVRSYLYQVEREQLRGQRT